MNSRVGGVADENRARPGPPRTGLRPWGGDEAESEGCGGSTVEDENEVWPDLRRNPEGWGQFSSFLRHASLEDSPYSSLLTPRTEKNWLPAPPAGKFITGSSGDLYGRASAASTQGIRRLRRGKPTSRQSPSGTSMGEGEVIGPRFVSYRGIYYLRFSNVYRKIR